MTIPTRKIEDRAIGAINCLIDQHPTMDSHIQKGDKDLSWDGYIRIFKNDDCIKDKINFLGDVPVQVKGHIDKERKYMNKKRIKYFVDVNDMRNYYKERGCLYFQIFMSEDGLEREIFYCSLYTSKLKRIFGRSWEQRRRRTFNTIYKAYARFSSLRSSTCTIPL